MIQEQPPLAPAPAPAPALAPARARAAKPKSRCSSARLWSLFTIIGASSTFALIMAGVFYFHENYCEVDDSFECKTASFFKFIGLAFYLFAAAYIFARLLQFLLNKLMPMKA